MKVVHRREGAPPLDRGGFWRRTRRSIRQGPWKRQLGERRTHRRQPLQRARDVWLIVGEMTHEDADVAKFLKGPKLFGDFVDRSRDERLCRNTAIASAQRMLQHGLRLGRRLADEMSRRKATVFGCLRKRRSAHDRNRLYAGVGTGKAGAGDQPSASRAARSMVGGALARIPTSTGRLDAAPGSLPLLGTVGRTHRLPANRRRTMSNGASNAEGWVRMLAPIAAKRFAPTEPALHDEGAPSDGGQRTDLLRHQHRMSTDLRELHIVVRLIRSRPHFAPHSD